ncbi:MAG: DMT family transporter [Eubacteriales bacterium]|nr:DMT family transporter [Eubacteriales bacterium]
MKLRNSLLLLLTATIWGVAFVAQSIGMDHVGPLTFLFARSVIAGIMLLPVVAVLRKNGAAPPPRTAAEGRRARRTLWLGGLCCGAALCAASICQQVGLLYTTVGKSGFLTACYILIVPLFGLLFGRRCGKLVWCGVALAIVGLYLLCLTDGLHIGWGDAITFCCAILFAVHILVIDHFAPRTDGVAMSCIQFFVCAAIAGVGMLLFEQPTLAAVLAAWKPILYAGALSSGVGYTLQIIGQKGVDPTVASLIMSLESVVSVLAGWLILKQAMSGRELLGCALMFAAIVLVQLPDRTAPRRKEGIEQR